VSIDLPVLKKGSKGEAVRTMQWLLIRNGYDMEGYGADGSFGGATERALKAFQEANGLEVDGSCGRKTWNKLLGVSTS
jgi:peptidoglycan hydrolase-like protein with peptidoglycan-binding domain